MYNTYSINYINILLGATESLMLKSKQTVKTFLPAIILFYPTKECQLSQDWAHHGLQKNIVILFKNLLAMKENRNIIKIVI